MKTVDVGAVIDDGRWTGYQKLLIVGTALTIILDGVDNQLLPNAVPFIAPEWGVQNSAFRNALATGPFGMMIGGLMGGILGDRYGRRTALLGSVMTFAILTLSIAFVELRLHARPASIPRRHRPRWRHAQCGRARLRVCSASSTSVRRDADHRLHSARWLRCQHDGRLIGPAYGWRALFIVGGLVPVVLAFVLWKVLRITSVSGEPPRSLARR